MEEEHANDTMTRAIEFEEVDKGVLEPCIFRKRTSYDACSETYNGCGEGAVQPTPTLTNKLRGGFWYISFGLARLDVGEGPSILCFSDKLETQNTILG